MTKVNRRVKMKQFIQQASSTQPLTQTTGQSQPVQSQSQDTTKKVDVGEYKTIQAPQPSNMGVFAAWMNSILKNKCFDVYIDRGSIKLKLDSIYEKDEYFICNVHGPDKKPVTIAITKHEEITINFAG